jgi:hypothetical protein
MCVVGPGLFTPSKLSGQLTHPVSPCVVDRGVGEQQRRHMFLPLPPAASLTVRTEGQTMVANIWDPDLPSQPLC